VAHGFWKRCAGAVGWLREFLKSGSWGWCWDVADCSWISGDVRENFWADGSCGFGLGRLRLVVVASWAAPIRARPMLVRSYL
jgi:hypothetical protein